MSSYIKTTRHPTTGKWESAHWMDDYYGPHQYGVKFPDGQVFNPQHLELATKDTEHKPSKMVAVAKLTDYELTIFIENARTGNIQSKLDLIMHNQGVINDKLNLILKRSKIKY